MWIGTCGKIVLNLISNAFKFTLAGSITVRLRPVDGAAELQVSDTGTGIPAEERFDFDRFYRVKGTQGHSPTGLRHRPRAEERTDGCIAARSG